MWTVIKTASDLIGQQVNILRKKRRWSLRRLAEECKARGVDLGENALENIEYARKAKRTRRRQVTVDEWLALAYVLDVAPIHLLIPPDVPAEIAITPEVAAHALVARHWVRGTSALPGQDSLIYYGEVPNEELFRNRQLGQAGVYSRDADGYVPMAPLPNDEEPQP
jgi:hypothetical protein